MPKIIGESLASHRELTRTRLFEALGSLMAEQAFESITMSQIAERAGVGRAAVSRIPGGGPLNRDAPACARLLG